MKIFRYFILLLFPVVSIAQPSYDEQLDYIYSIRMDRSAEARNLLENLSKSVEKFSVEEKSRYFVLVAHSKAMQAHYKEALDFTDKAINVASDIDLISAANSLKARVLYFSGQYRESFLVTHEVLDTLDRVKDVNLKNDILMNAVGSLISSGIYDKAQALSLQNLALAKVHKNDDMVCHSSFQLANIKKSIGQNFAAKAEIEKALLKCSKVNNRLYILGLKELFAHISLLQKDYDEANKLYLALYQESKDFGWEIQLAAIQTRLAESFLALKELSKVEQYAIPAYRYSKKTNDYQHLKLVTLVLAKFYKETGDLKKARLYNQEYRDAMVITSQQLEKSRLGYYQAMNDRQKSKVNNPNLALKKINSN